MLPRPGLPVAPAVTARAALRIACLGACLGAAGCLDLSLLQGGDLARGEAGTPPDLLSTDLAGDGGDVDLAAPDLLVDLAPPDLAAPDLAAPDLVATPDLTAPDLAQPDLTVLDLVVLDLVIPDLVLCGNGVRDGDESDVDCGGAGTCRRCDDGKVCFGDRDCKSTSYCDGANAVCTPKRALGAACSPSDPTVCLSGKCVDNVCCEVDATQCDGCRKCGPAGKCIDVPKGEDPHKTCTADTSKCLSDNCDGAGTCRADNGTKCQTDTCTGAANNEVQRYSCNAGTCTPQTTTPCSGDLVCNAGACKTSCAADTDCIKDHYCAESKCWPVLYKTPVAVNVGKIPKSLAAADFGADGNTDLVVANSFDHTVTILRGNGDGTFSFVSAQGTGTTPNSIVAAEMTGDGAPDFAVACRDVNQIQVFRGLGSHAFTLASMLPSGSDSIAAARIDGDALSDIAVAEITPQQGVSIYIATGGGNFLMPKKLSWNNKPVSIAIGNLVSTSTPDIVAPLDIGRVGVFAVADTGAIMSPTLYDAQTSPRWAAVADLDGGGTNDIIVSNFGSNTVSVLSNLGGGNFSTAQNYPVGAAPLGVAAADLNGDSIIDLAVVNYDGNSVTVLLGKTGGGFQGVRAYALNGGTGPYALVIADFNKDGKPDIATANSGTNNVSVLIAR